MKQHAAVQTHIKFTVLDTAFNEKSFSGGQPHSADGQEAHLPAMQQGQPAGGASA